ncbi:30S ribosome-binding factor RbfA [Corynebacterium amycolatum]|uniref:Ribosome-binding factor A n=1 Tax=Corynebacterium amycolatum TaxID=43765 RepID=A0AB37GEJ4_CORAY|nr:30S ribosome-binding factor RbfA [Corynebacterium amycolatum]MCQ9128394.1 30S ribosome-binding factor RbfA [Corynebacterium amycolatum]MCQ9142390.1 30S ribosome-binding factor RbfA [Corynebacterium amycolatum]MCQ9169566.1 30S ribosome-binding factor RbfA [Corynebacterium amycolatum]MCQ9175690.1 30S ribosome-binding factor RbfA [Corynebacterium amycolatum]QPR30263.1 30S ribosome-binding factor RbfA [Corynebacterium amycolatum]
MADPARARRLSKRIQEIVASAIEREIKDRRLEFVTITDCRVTGDLHDATVFYTVRGRTLDEEPDYESVAAALEKAKGQLRSLVGRGTGVRYTPTLAFEVDTVPEISAHLEELLDKTRVRDAELAEQARNAKPAGDANPYRDEE